MKVVINRCYGGFGLSEEALRALCERKGLEYSENCWYDEEKLYDTNRDDADLVAVVEQLGDDANGPCAKLVIVEIPDDVVQWDICEHDGNEWIAEAHRRWF